MVHSLEAKVLFVALLVGLAHIVSGAAVFFVPAALDVTPLASLHHLTVTLGFTNGFAGVILAAAGFMAVAGSCLNYAFPKFVHSVLFMPQQLLLLLQIWTISMALIVGHYPDGYTPIGGSWFILADQSWAWILAVSHSAYLAAFIYGSANRGALS